VRDDLQSIGAQQLIKTFVCTNKKGADVLVEGFEERQ
jgi:hypothetical protein